LICNLPDEVDSDSDSDSDDEEEDTDNDDEDDDDEEDEDDEVDGNGGEVVADNAIESEDEDKDDDESIWLRLPYVIGQTVECKTGPEEDDWGKSIITKLNYKEKQSANSARVPYQVRLLEEEEDDEDDNDNDNDDDDDDDEDNEGDDSKNSSSNRYIFVPEDTKDYVRTPRRKFHEYFRCWIPTFATYAVTEYTKNQLKSCNNKKYIVFDIIAVYGLSIGYDIGIFFGELYLFTLQMVSFFQEV